MSKIGIFDREIPRLAPKPEPSENLRQNVQCLDGIWEFCHWQNVQTQQFDGWHSITVPSHIGKHADEAEGFTGIYSYRRKISLLPRWNTARKLIKFEGINGHARVFINGVFLAEHWNGFLTWTVDITEVCSGKEEVLLQVDVDETQDRVGSFYHGGILHSVWLYLLPQTYISMLHLSTELDCVYKNARLTVDCSAEAHLQGCEVEGMLFDPSGEEIPEAYFCTAIENQVWDVRVQREISMPILWDAEHPYLYTMQLRVCRGAEVLETVRKRFGFRQIERHANRVYVNGKEIKLRGVCRHEVSPLHGRCLTREMIDEDVRLFKEANCNYIRTSHYSPSEYFLDACDREGIYVENELGLAFIAKSTPYTQRDPGETGRYLSHFQEAMARDYSHPCVLIWSLCNESFGGFNFDVLNRYVHRMDPTRMTKFSYPMTMQPEHEPVDVWSIHYTNQDVDLSEKRDNVSVGFMEGKDVPVIHDEYAHIPCYNREEHRRDPNVRNFWGQSIKRFWDKIWNTPGALGGAIWAGIDETDVFTGGNTQLEWGIIDIWRRRKPEFYLVRKAYSPVVIKEQSVRRKEDKSVVIKVENRFCHTDLSETEVLYTIGNISCRVRGPQAAPGCTGALCLTELPEGKTLTLHWRDAFGKSVDEYHIQLEDTEETVADTKELQKWKMQCSQENIILTRGESCLIFDTRTARIREGISQGETILMGGPDINMNGVVLGAWEKEEIYAVDGAVCEVTLSGWYGREAKVTFLFRFCPDGHIHLNYHMDELNIPMPDRIKLRVSVTPGGLNEIGVSLDTVPEMDVLSWRRRGQWSMYPKDHIARTEGTALRYSKGSVFGQKPQILWKDEMKSVILNGKYDVDYRGTNDFRSQKEHIYEAHLMKSSSKGALTVLSDGSHSVRAEVQEPTDLIVSCKDPRIRYGGKWYEMTDPRRGAFYREMWSEESGSFAELTFEGTGVVWYGPVDVICGYARVLIDNQVMDDKILQRVNGVDFPGSADGYDKKYHYPLYSVDGLCYGTHTIRIEPLGKGSGESQAPYIIIEQFRILDGSHSEPVRLYINNAYNYPMISWGNYCREPILIQKGYENQVVFCLE